MNRPLYRWNFARNGTPRHHHLPHWPYRTMQCSVRPLRYPLHNPSIGRTVPALITVREHARPRRSPTCTVAQISPRGSPCYVASHAVAAVSCNTPTIPKRAGIALFTRRRIAIAQWMKRLDFHIKRYNIQNILYISMHYICIPIN
jgi:hypothetical protein